MSIFSKVVFTTMEMNRKKFRDHPTIVELKKKTVDDSIKISLVQSITDEELLSYIAIYIKDNVMRRTAFLRIVDEQKLKQIINKIKEIETLQNVDQSFFDEF